MLVFVQNDPECPAGTYGETVSSLGLDNVVCTPFAGERLPSVGAGDAIIVLGGAMGVHEVGRHPFLADVKRFVAEAVAASVPLLGICLGGQILAEVAGGRVTPSSGCGEKGVHDIHLTVAGGADPLFAGLPSSFRTFQWHDDSFDVPPEGIQLAGSPVCPCQAFRVGRAYGVQFHPEVDAGIVRSWASGTPSTAADTETFVARFVDAGADYRSASLAMLRNFLTGAGLI